MKTYSLVLPCFFFLLESLSAQPGIPSFPILPNDIELTRPARPGTYFDKAGRKFAVLGVESGRFEAWAYPLKLFRDFEFSFFIGSSTEPILARDIVRRISVTPEATTLVYTFQSFTVRAIFITPIREPGAYVLLDVDTQEPMSIVCSFIPVLQPMWPAGIGGQSAVWLDDIKAYRISEPTRKNTAFVGSPDAVGMSYTPAHMLSDRPNQFRIVVDRPAAVRGRYLPVVICGGRGPRDSLKAIYTRLVSEPQRQYVEAAAHYDRLQKQTLRVSTPNLGINLAFAWAKVAYDNLFVDNPDVGLGMVAGLGTSGSGGRPGFGWFFGGDAFINSFSLNCYGAYSSVRDALLFTHKWQRADGKMAHELTQAAAYVDWWKDYPYGYIHGDTSPFYVCAVWDYYRHTADSQFVRDHWSVLKKAYEWSLATDENGDGLMDNKRAGLGALEYGPLTDIQSDVYTGAVWVRAASAMPPLARTAGDSLYAEEAERYHARAAKAFDEKFWDPKRQQYAYAFTAKGEHVDIVSPWSSVGLMWELGDPVRSIKSMLKLNSSELSTDWGIRSISNASSYYEPLNYNYGAVWPFLTSWVATAQFKHHLGLQGYASLLASAEHTFDNGLGMLAEVFSGSQNIWPQEAVAHQGFSSASVVLPLVRGLLGIEGDATTRRLQFSPQLPADWTDLGVEGLDLGPSSFRFQYNRSRERVVLRVESNGSEGYQFSFAPALGVGTQIQRVRINGIETSYRLIVSAQSIQPLVEMTLSEEPVTIEVEFVPTLEFLSPRLMAHTGDRNMSMKILGFSRRENEIAVTAEGRGGMVYDLGLVNEDVIEKVDGCTLQGNVLKISFPGKDGDEFVSKEFKVSVRQ